MPCPSVDLKLLWFWTGPKPFWIWVKKQNYIDTEMAMLAQSKIGPI